MHEGEFEEQHPLSDQPITPSPSVITDAAQQETEGDHDDNRRRVEEPETPLSPVAQDKAPELNLVPPNLETSKDEIIVDVPMLEEPEGMSNDQLQGWITEEAFFILT